MNTFEWVIIVVPLVTYSLTNKIVSWKHGLTLSCNQSWIITNIKHQNKILVDMKCKPTLHNMSSRLQQSYYVKAELVGGNGPLSLGQETRNWKGRRYALFPEIFSRRETYLWEWMKLSEDLMSVFLQWPVSTVSDFKPIQTVDSLLGPAEFVFVVNSQLRAYRSLPSAKWLVETNMKQKKWTAD